MKKLLLLLFIAILSVGAAAQDAAEKAAETTESQPQSVNQMIDSVKTFIAENGIQFLINLITAAAIFFIGKWIAKMVASLLKKAMDKANVDPTLSKFAKNLSYAVLLIFVVLASLRKLGVPTTSAVAILGAAGLAVGFALQGSLSNFAAGIMMIIFKPFSVGDYIEAAGTAGIVKEIDIFNTILNTVDNKRVIVPNGQITSDNIVNYSSNDTRRVDLVIGVSYDDDLKKAKQVIEDVIKADRRILEDPAYTVAVSELGDSSVNFVVRPWVNSADYWSVRFDLTEKIKVSLEENGLSIPFPQRDVHLFNASASAS
jgi:small conductance mechanosensitive channel